MFGAWGRFVYRFRWLVLAASLALVAASVFGIITLSTSLSSDDGDELSMESERTAALIRQELPQQSGGPTFPLIFRVCLEGEVS